MDKKTKKRRTDAEFRALDYEKVRLGDNEMMKLTGASRTTVLRWRSGQCPPPPAALRLARLAYYGNLSEIGGRQWEGFQLGRDGRLYIPGFKYGFLPEELGQWYRLIHERHAISSRLALAERDLALAETALEAAEARADYYRRQVSLEASSGLMLARLAA